MDRTSLMALATSTYTATTGTAAVKMQAALQAVIDAMRPGYCIVAIDGDAQFVQRWNVVPGGSAPGPGRPILPDVISFAASMEAYIATAKGTANDPDTMTNAQLATAAKALAGQLPALIDAANATGALANVTKLAAIAVVYQSRLV